MMENKSPISPGNKLPGYLGVFFIVAAGSLLGVAIHNGVSYPVGKVELLDLYPLNFREFLYAMMKKILRMR